MCLPCPYPSRDGGNECGITERGFNPHQGARLARADFRVSLAAQSEECLCFNPPLPVLDQAGDCEAAALLMALGPLLPIFPIPKVAMRSRRLAIGTD